MASKTHKLLPAITLVELLLAISVMALLIAITVSLNMPTYQAKSRDEHRISDLSTFERVVAEYVIDNNAFPGSVNTTYTSLVLPTGHTGELASASNGWFPVDVSSITSVMKIDPLNNEAYFYSYRHNGVSFELNARLETLQEGTTDNGNNNDVYEIGSDLSIL